MHPSMFLLAVVVFAVPTRAITSLSTLESPSARLGSFFDAGPRWVRRLTAEPPRLPETTRPRVPFVLDIPVVPPAPFARTFQRLLADKPTGGYDELIRGYAERQGLDPRLVKSVIAAESEFTARRRPTSARAPRT